MAQTFIAYYPNIAFAATKNMAAIINQHATEVLKVREVVLSNAQTTGVTGVICQMELRWYTAGTLTGPTAVTPVKLDSTNTNPTTAVYGHAGTIGGTPSTLWAWLWSSDEAAVSLATSDELECFTPLNKVYEWIPHSDIQPITLRGGATEMCMVYNVSGAAGTLYTRITFTKE
jgi:hypothetical protein